MDCDFIIEDGLLKEYKGNSKDIVIPNGVKIIGDHAFMCRNGNTIESVVMPDTVVEVRDKAFHECYNLRNIVFPKNLEVVGACAFCGLAISHLVLPEKLRKVGWGAFCDYRTEKLVELILPPSLEVVEERAFAMHPLLNEVKIPSNLKGIIPDEAFDKNCKLIWI